jgi:multiple sugar transport system permease protein
VVVYYVFRSIRDVAYGTGAAASYVVAGGLVLLSAVTALVTRWRAARRFA